MTEFEVEALADAISRRLAPSHTPMDCPVGIDHQGRITSLESKANKLIGALLLLTFIIPILTSVIIKFWPEGAG